MTRFLDVTPRLPVADLQRTIRFYSDRLHFRTEVLWPSAAPSFAILARDTARVGFFERSGDAPTDNAVELYVDVTDAVALHTTLQRDLPVEWGPEVYSYGRREFAVRDPDGYLLIFTQATTEPATTHEP